MTSLERYQAQLDRCCRRIPTHSIRPITALERMAKEAEEAAKLWQELQISSITKPEP